jgi:hypothetical protein
MRTDELQRWLLELGFDPGPIDGDYGPKTEEAVFDALEEYAPPRDLAPPPSTNGENVVPADWMPNAKAVRVICHWTAGGNTANSTDKEHYHILIEGNGKLIRGDHSISDNDSTSDNDYAAHTASCNTGSIGVSLCCMSGAVESPFNAGPYPMTSTQWNMLSDVVADLCTRYNIPVSPTTVLSHAEVQSNLGIAQSGKWDYTKLAFDPSMSGAKACGDRLRREVTSKL